jgi:hypothetical protein
MNQRSRLDKHQHERQQHQPCDAGRERSYVRFVDPGIDRDLLWHSNHCVACHPVTPA